MLFLVGVTDCLWIYHLQDARDGKAKEVTRSTVSETELARLTRSINVQLKIVQQGNKRGVEVLWARAGRSGLVIWDETGCWSGMPEKIEAELYDGLTSERKKKLKPMHQLSSPTPKQPSLGAMNKVPSTVSKKLEKDTSSLKNVTIHVQRKK